ncbi:Dam family site-specific DNA-(adenine-N6)-methyltransferase [Serratia marcescens]|uniref:Site-specific DNA-methyltransferase (adenine-specific) n=1 Tax=Serratia marcescens TaxID=615 RepID=A0A5C7C8H8_SERMA|nr:Dam family site-specific DNA-(adenine-N6)-methyltransferase [Serratia marcescens]TXE33231.1 Dam family site-specific DNA-(adenine-N6)-methyltransferase [Serratia marcescens]TXE65245.1 Dam family site-specific DNA-(adenine-N6)-methyltransferase [Serratia marcescens]
MIRSPLKWAGSKARIMDTLRQHLPTGNRLIEPFAGSASVFLNTDYHSYLLADINPDLIGLFNTLKTNPDDLIDCARLFFKFDNSEVRFRVIRDSFNTNDNEFCRAVMFLYLNRHCYNGLCRYNSNGRFNVPYGKYAAPYFPEEEIRRFAEKAKNTAFLCLDFEETIEMAGAGDVVYCDPPYIPISDTANFTKYHTAGFTPEDHSRMIAALHAAAARGCLVVVSNAAIAEDVYRYSGFIVHQITAPRSVSCKGSQRKAAREIIATLEAAS